MQPKPTIDGAPVAAAPPPNPLRSFSTFLANVESGALNHDLSRSLETAVAAIQNAYLTAGGKPVATITLVLGLRMDSGHVQVGAKIDSKLPKPPRGTSIYYPTPDHTLSVSDPKQTSLALREVTDTGGGIRTINNDTGEIR